MFKNSIKILTSERGAMFGLDSRIALAIFAVISVLTGAFAMVNINTFQAQGFSEEITKMRTAIGGIHRDLQRGLHGTLITNNSTNAYQSLYDSSVIEATYRNKWVGPYVERETSTHPKFGTMLIERLEGDHNTVCGANTCYLWLSYASVTEAIITKLNDVLDGEGEVNPESSGDIQWTGSTPYKLWFKVSVAIN